MMNYVIVSNKSAEEIVTEVNAALEDHGKEMQSVHLSKVNGKERIAFNVDGTRNEHRDLSRRLRQSEDLHNFECVPGVETE